MCSIIGFIGNSRAAPVVVESLKKMEYRGYDSVGIATINSGKIMLKKGVGRVVEVNNQLNLMKMPGNIGVGHTRWATHGGVTESNAHPHDGCKKNIVVVHNGIIENFREIKKDLEQHGHIFKSQTDSEVIAHLIESNLVDGKGNIKKALTKTCTKLKGAFAFVVAFEDGSIAGARLDEPLIIGLTNDGYFISSDVLGFLEYTDRAIFLENKDIVIIDKNGMNLFDFNGKKISKQITQVAWELGEIDKGDYAHHTIKEIHEQKKSIEKAMLQDNERVNIFCNTIRSAKNIFFTGSGSSYHAALVAKNLLSRFGKIRSEVIMSSEFQYNLDNIDKDSVIIAISQSGETADVLQSIKIAKEKNAKILSIVNVHTSSLARLSDCYLGINCGPEIGVAATKSFTGQLAIFYMIIDKISDNATRFVDNMKFFQEIFEGIIQLEGEIERIAEVIKDAKDIYILGKSLHYPIALEGSLKIKELAYIHAEGIAAGELKHGPLALIENNTAVIVLNPEDETFNDTLRSTNEIKSRGAYIIGISNKEDIIFDRHIKIPTVNKSFYPIIEVIPIQLLSYYLALKRETNPDYPRNLAKSVTVR
ncbi:MAG: glutamine--fructose-6-phosphate transaminase (isomerizing) [Nitrososphaeraceae archaeon]|nr:glutamine--fructose-6-phosphate transaminase (isomerizing) [Nitrososphaeraceae archaeon]